jgi:enoyl-CoA hydratase/carnithine racemase
MNDLNPARPIITDINGSTATIRFNRPAERNSLSTVNLAELDTLLSTLIEDRNLRTLIFTGTGNTFLSGADIRELATLDSKTALDFSRTGQRLFQRIADAPQTTIAAVNGFCMGGGMDLALACHIRLASPNAVFAHPGARLGIITGWGGTQRLPRLIGKSRTIELFTTARRFTSNEALKIGLITGIYDPVLAGALKMAKTL